MNPLPIATVMQPNQPTEMPVIDLSLARPATLPAFAPALLIGAFATVGTAPAQSAVDECRKLEFDKATASAKEAEALAKASIFQATSEKTRWREMDIR